MRNKTIDYIAYALIIIGIVGRTISKLMSLPDEPLMFFLSIAIYIGLLLLNINRAKHKDWTSRIGYGVILAALALWLIYDGINLFAIKQ